MQVHTCTCTVKGNTHERVHVNTEKKSIYMYIFPECELINQYFFHCYLIYFIFLKFIYQG